MPLVVDWWTDQAGQTSWAVILPSLPCSTFSLVSYNNRSQQMRHRAFVLSPDGGDAWNVLLSGEKGVRVAKGTEHARRSAPKQHP